jgi:hypothetical protein
MICSLGNLSANDPPLSHLKSKRALRTHPGPAVDNIDMDLFKQKEEDLACSSISYDDLLFASPLRSKHIWSDTDPCQTGTAPHQSKIVRTTLDATLSYISSPSDRFFDLNNYQQQQQQQHTLLACPNSKYLHLIIIYYWWWTDLDVIQMLCWQQHKNGWSPWQNHSSSKHLPLHQTIWPLLLIYQTKQMKCNTPYQPTYMHNIQQP